MHHTLNKKAGLHVIQSHSLYQRRFSHHRQYWGDWEMGTAISCSKWSQVAGLIHMRQVEGPQT